jgi:hypothetical protein
MDRLPVGVETVTKHRKGATSVTRSHPVTDRELPGLPLAPQQRVTDLTVTEQALTPYNAH